MQLKWEGLLLNIYILNTIAMVPSRSAFFIASRVARVVLPAVVYATDEQQSIIPFSTTSTLQSSPHSIIFVALGNYFSDKFKF